MSVNDRELGGNKGVDTYPGVANPTTHNGVNDPMALNFVRACSLPLQFQTPDCLTGERPYN